MGILYNNKSMGVRFRYQLFQFRQLLIRQSRHHDTGMFPGIIPFSFQKGNAPVQMLGNRLGNAVVVFGND